MSTPPTSGLRVESIRIRDFRGIADARLRLEPELTVLIGENNVGKTSILLALMTALGGRAPSRDDASRNASGRAVRPAVLDVVVAPQGTTDMRVEVLERFGPPSRLAGTDDSHVVRSAFRTEVHRTRDGAARATRTLLQFDGSEWQPAQRSWQPQVLELIAPAYLGASRDLARDVAATDGDWGRVLTDLEIDESQGTSREELEVSLGETAERLLASSRTLSQLTEDLLRTNAVQAAPTVLELRALPRQIEDVARSIDIAVSRGDVSLPLALHGAGTRSLAALMVFRTLTRLRVGRELGFTPAVVTAIEEPEAHLHPQSVTALGAELTHLDGQVVVTTHSPHLVNELSTSALRVVRVTAGMTSIREVGSIAATSAPPARQSKREAQFRQFVDRPYGAMWFARAVVFGDGQSERDVLPVLLRPLLGADPAAYGVVFADPGSMGKGDAMGNVVGRALPLLERVGIRWVLFCDGDDGGQTALEKIDDPAAPDSELTKDHPNVVWCGEQGLEAMLLGAGYGDLTEPGDKSPLEWLVKQKSWANLDVARAAVAEGRPAPEPIERLAHWLRGALGLAEIPSR